jgi:zinc protease
MDNEPIPNIADDYAIYKNFADTISISDINQLIKNYITDDNMFIYASAVEKNGITPPTQEQLLANYQKLKNSTFDEYQDKFSDKALFSKEVNAGTIVKTTEIKAVGITEFVLSNGIKVLVKPTGFNDSEVLFHAFSKGGMSLVPIKEYLNGKYAAQIIAASGIADFNMPILQKLLTGKYVKISPYINDVSEGFSGNSFTKDVETLLQLLNLYFTQPHKDQESFQSFVTRTKQWVDNSKRHPSTEFIEAISYIMSGNDPHNQPITKEMIESLDLDKSYQIYQERFADPSDFTFVFVGNIDLEKFKPFLTQYLASLPTKGSKENFKDIFNDKPKQAIKKDFYKGKEDKSTLVLKLNGAADYNLKNIYIASALEKILNYRLIDKLREEKSEVYSPSASLSISHYPKPEYNLTIQLGCKPSNVASLIKTVKGILQELQTQLPSDEDMQKIKEADKRQYETNLKENSYWMSKIIQAYHHGLDVQQILHYPELIASLSKEDIRKAAQEYFKLHSLKEFVLYPEKK